MEAQAQAAPDATYTAWVLRVRALQAEQRNMLLRQYDEIRLGREENIWSRGPWHSFEEVLTKEFGLDPKRFAHFEASIERFGRDRVDSLSFDGVIPLLRLTPGSKEEDAVLKRVDTITQDYSRPPSPDAIRKIVAGTEGVKRLRPVQTHVSEVDRLREAVRRLQEELRETRAKLSQARTQLAAEHKLRETAERKQKRAEAALARYQKAQKKR